MSLHKVTAQVSIDTSTFQAYQSQPLAATATHIATNRLYCSFCDFPFHLHARWVSESPPPCPLLKLLLHATLTQQFPNSSRQRDALQQKHEQNQL